LSASLVGVVVVDDKDLHDLRGLDHELHFGHLGDGFIERGTQAGLGGDDEGEAVAGVAAVLQDGVDVDANLGERAGDGGDDAGGVFDNEAQVVRGEDVSGDLDFVGREADADAAFGDGEDVAGDGYCCGCPPAPWPEKTTSPPNLPLVTTMFCVPCDQAMGEVVGTSIGPTRALTFSPSS